MYVDWNIIWNWDSGLSMTHTNADVHEGRSEIYPLLPVFAVAEVSQQDVSLSPLQPLQHGRVAHVGLHAQAVVELLKPK